MNLKKISPAGPQLIVIAAVLWALDGIVRRSLYVLPPVTIVFMEHLVGSLLILPFAWPFLRKIKFNQKVIGLTAIIALFSGLLGTLWFTTALLKVNFIPFSVVFLIQKLQPLFAIGAASVFLKEKITPKYGVWAVLALAAAFFVTFPNGVVNLETGAGTVTAALYALGAAAAWGSMTVFSKMLLTEVKSDTAATALRFGVTTLFAALALPLLAATSSLQQVGATELGRLVFIALSTGMVALWIYYRGLAKTQAKISTLLELTFPLLAVFIDMFLYKTWLQPSQYLAAVALMYVMYQVGKLNKAK